MLGDLLLKVIEGTATKQEVERLAEQLNGWERTLGRIGGKEAKFDSIFAEAGEFRRLPHEAAILSSLSAPHATLTNNTDTTIQDMSGTVQRLGLRVDETNFSYIEFESVPNESLYLWNFTVDFAVSSVGDRELRWQLYNRDTSTWEASYYTERLRAENSGKTTLNSALIYHVVDDKYRRVRVQLKQTSGGDLAIDIPQFRVLRLR